MMEPRFDIFTTRADGHVFRLFENVSLAAAEIMSGMERKEFDSMVERQGWIGTSPAWTSFRPVVILPHGTMIRHDQFVYLIELAG